MCSGILRRWFSISTAVAVSLAACAPGNVKPQLAAQTSQTLGMGGPGRTDPVEGWWRAFGDPQLDGIMADALGQPVARSGSGAAAGRAGRDRR